METAEVTRMKELVQKLNEAAKAYYQEDREIMSNREYDALYDVLTELPPCTLLLEHTGCLYDALGPYAEKLLGVFRDAARENPNIQIQEDIKTF